MTLSYRLPTAFIDWIIPRVGYFQICQLEVSLASVNVRAQTNAGRINKPNSLLLKLFMIVSYTS